MLMFGQEGNYIFFISINNNTSHGTYLWPNTVPLYYMVYEDVIIAESTTKTRKVDVQKGSQSRNTLVGQQAEFLLVNVCMAMLLINCLEVRG